MTINVVKDDEHLTQYLTRRTFTISDQFTSLDSFLVVQLHYTGWPDFGVPYGPSMASFEIMLDAFITHMISSPEKAIVHCSAGVGRTGTTIALAQIIVQLWAQKNAGVEDPRFSIFSIVRRMR